MNMTDDEEQEFYEKYGGVIDPVNNFVDYDTLATLVESSKGVWQLREENEKLTKILDHYKRQCIVKHEEIQRYHKVFYDCVMNFSAAFSFHEKETEQLRKDIEGYKAIWDYLDPKGHAWEEEEFVALLKEHGFEVGEEE